MDGLLAATDAWRYLQTLECSHAVYEVEYGHHVRWHVAISRHGHIIATAADPDECVANALAILRALRAVIRTPYTTWTELA